MIKERLRRLRAFLKAQGADAVLINKEVNLHYFSGFRRALVLAYKAVVALNKVGFPPPQKKVF